MCLHHHHQISGGGGSDFAIGTTPSYAPESPVRPTHQDISLDFDIALKRVHVTVQTTFTNTTAFECIANLEINGVSFESLKVSGDKVSHVYNGKIIALAWTQKFAPNEQRVVTFEYMVVEPIGGLYFSSPDKDHPSRASYAITDLETEKCRYWLACVDYPTVRTTLDFHMTAPSSYVALANGAHVATKVNANGTSTTHYSLQFPCPSYLICFAVGEFIEVDDGVCEGMPLKYFAPKGTDPKDVFRAFDKTRSMILWMTKKLGVKFPWPKYYQISAPHVRGAMENISLVTWSEMYLMDETWAKERKHLTDSVVLHEMAHSFFGDCVVIRHFEHAWLKESWATYCESLWMEDCVSRDAFEFEMLENADGYMGECNRYMRPISTKVWDSSWTMFDMHLYPGGAWRLHMLRHLLGNDCFWKAVNDYIVTYTRKTVETDDFRRILEKHSGLNLTKFFDQWIYSKGYPKLKGTFEYKLDGCFTQITLEQTQVNKSTNVSYFDFILDVEVTDTAGKIHTSQIEFKGENIKACCVIPMNTKPVMVRINPENKVLVSIDMNPGEDILLNTAKDAKDIANRVWAFRELVKGATPSALRKVREAIASEPHYGVRVKVAEAVSKLKIGYSAHILADMLAEKDPRAMWGIAKCCRLKDDTLRTALLAFLGRDDLSYRGRGVALECLASQRNPLDLSYLRAVAKDDKLIGQHGLTRQGAMRALGQDRTKESFEFLMSRILNPSLEIDRVRAAVFDAIASSAVWQNVSDLRRAIEVVSEGLMDDHFMVKRSCLIALVELEAREKSGHLESMKLQCPEQDWPYIERRIKALRSGGGGVGPGLGNEKVKELTKNVEELEGKVRKLEDKMFGFLAKQEAAEVAKKKETEENEAVEKAYKA